MKLCNKILIILLITLQLLFGQTVEDLKQVRKAYEDIIRMKQAEEQLAKELGREDILIDEIPTKILVKPEDILTYYSEKMGRIQTELKDLQDLIPLIQKEKRLKYFGYNYFFVRDTLSYWQNRPIPANYPLGPGDEMVISLWGETEQIARETINRDGTIFVENVGTLYLGGKTINSAKKYILDRYSAVYATLRGKTPSSFLDISLGKLKGINIQVTGSVNAPGFYALNPMSTITTALSVAGGIDTTGSMRMIKVIRNGLSVDTLDFYSLLLGGNEEYENRLLEMDIIHVPSRKSIVTVDGAVWQPAHYEMIPGETINDLLGFAGGIKPNAGNTYVLVHRFKDGTQAEYIFPKDLNEIIVENGDSLYVPTKQLPLLTISIKGEVASPGSYPWFNGLTLRDLIQVSGAENGNMQLFADWKKAELVRLQNDGGGFASIPVDVSGLLSGNMESDIPLQPFDHLTIPRKNDFIGSRSVVIQGEVSVPGTYPLLHDKETLASLINRTGGVTSSGFIDGITIRRKRYDVGWKDQSVYLIPGDTVNVPIKTGTVYVAGAVNRSSFFTWEKGKSAKYYINLAGGLRSSGDPKNIRIIFPNGQGSPVTFWRNPNVPEGASIFISEKPVLERAASSMDVVQQIAGIAGSLATLVLIIRTQ